MGREVSQFEASFSCAKSIDLLKVVERIASGCPLYVYIRTYMYVLNYASRRSRTRDTVKPTVCVSVPAVTAQ